ncbi:ABC transporter permease [Shewanella sp. A3A]|nr:ABC transporter permease [Shewanella ferrihydritica]
MRITTLYSNLWSQKLVALLVIALLALALGAFGTTFSVYRMMAHNPLAAVNDRTGYVLVDDGDPEHELDVTPPLLSLSDAQQLFQLASDGKRAITYWANAIFQKPDEARLYNYSVRITSPDFFEMFGAQFQYGKPWSLAEDEQRAHKIVLSAHINQALFGGENSVGRQLLLAGESYTIAGVLYPFDMSPKVYDIHYEPFSKPEDIYLPFNTGIALQLPPQGRMLDWRNEEINTMADVLQSSMIWLELWVQYPTAAQLQALAPRLANYVAQQRAVGRMLRSGELYSIVSPADWLAQNHLVKNDNKVLLLLALVFLVICLLCVVGLLFTSYATRKRHFATYRALGASSLYLGKMLTSEVLLLTTVGCVLGSLLVWGGSSYLQHNLGSSYRHVLSLSSMLLAVGMIYLCALLSCVYPIVKHSRQLPAALLK